MNVVELPSNDVADIARGLRALADSIERGEYDEAHNLAWAVDCGNGRVECGMLGLAGESGAVAHLLFALAQRKLEDIVS